MQKQPDIPAEPKDSNITPKLQNKSFNSEIQFLGP